MRSLPIIIVAVAGVALGAIYIARNTKESIGTVGTCYMDSDNTKVYKIIPAPKPLKYGVVAKGMLDGVTYYISYKDLKTQQVVDCVSMEDFKE